MKILIVDDDPVIVAIVRAVLGASDYTVDDASTGETGLALAVHGNYDGILLDLGLGDRGGVSVLQELRHRGIATPVLVLTAEGSEDAIVRVLDAGADEYVVKPVLPAELTARVGALIRRGHRTPSHTDLVAGSLTFSRPDRAALVRGAPVHLSPAELSLLEQLMTFSGRVVERDVLARAVWGSESEPESNAIDVHMRRLRQKLAAAGAPVRIETRRGKGYSLIPEVAEMAVTLSQFA